MERDYSATLSALRRLSVQTGSLACLGCGMEHSCSTRGCAIIRDAIEHMEVGLERYDHWSALLDEYEARLHLCDGSGVDPAEHAAVCRERDRLHAELQSVIAKLHETESERDGLKVALDGAKLSLKALNEKLVKVTAERDGLIEIVRKGFDACDHCMHDGSGLPCGEMVPAPDCDECTLEKAICCKCYAGSHFEFAGENDLKGV